MSKQVKQLLTQVSPEDSRDYTPAVVGEVTPKELPDKYIPEVKQPIFMQWFSSECVAHAIVTMLQYCEQKLGWTPNNYSRGFIYANRNGEDMNVDGMYPRKALKILLKEGTCSYYSFRWGQSQLDRVIEKFEPQQEELEKEALQYRTILNYYRLNTIEDIKTAVYNNGAAIISIRTFGSFLFDNKLNPRKDYTGNYSNHCVAVIGWDGDYLICQDSYSKFAHLGRGGLFYLHKDYMINEAWSVSMNDYEPEKRPDIVVDENVKTWGYAGYFCEWLIGGVVRFFKKTFSKKEK